MSRVAVGRMGGFSLLELLVALTIMSMALGLLYQASTGALRAVSDIDQEQRATMLAQSLLESRDAVPAGGWNETGRSTNMDWRVSSTAYPTATSRANPTVPLLHQVAVTVDWASRRGPRHLEFVTLLPQQRPEPGGAQR